MALMGDPELSIATTAAQGVVCIARHRKYIQLEMKTALLEMQFAMLEIHLAQLEIQIAKLEIQLEMLEIQIAKLEIQIILLETKIAMLYILDIYILYYIHIIQLETQIGKL